MGEQKKRTVLVTGSSRGIGFSIARRFAVQGDRVVLNGCSDAAQLDESVAALRRINTETTGVMADMSDYQQAAEAFAQINSRFGPVEVLVNNAGAAHFGLFTDMNPPEWEQVLRVNLHSVLNATHLAVPEMVRARAGVIINISSVWGVAGASCEAVYAAAKGAVNAFTKSTAKELGPSGVRVCAVACGAIETRMNERLSPDEKNAFTENIPLMRFGTPDEAGGLVYFLASKEASYLTGQVIALDGGLL